MTSTADWEALVFGALVQAYGETAGGLDGRQLSAVTGIPPFPLNAILVALMKANKIVALHMDWGGPDLQRDGMVWSRARLRTIYHLAKSPAHFVGSMKKERR